MTGWPVYDAIVLTGGRGRRLGGADKAVLAIGGITLLTLTLNAVSGAGSIVLVGPDSHDAHAREWQQTRPRSPDIATRLEDPPGGGPAAAVAAAMSAVGADIVVVLAVDMPFIDRATIDGLVENLATGPSTIDAAMLVDQDGHRQLLTAAYRREALHNALASLGDPAGRAMRNVVDALTVAEVLADPGITVDIDTWADLERSRDLLEGQ